MSRLSLLTAAVVVATTGTSAIAANVTAYTELFPANNSLWTQNNAAAANWLATGGVGGPSDGYITTTFSVPTTTTTTPVIARATGSNNASGGLFVGNYANVTTISYYVKSDATFAVPVALRLGGASPGTAMTIDGGLLQPNSNWTLFNFDLSVNNPKILSFEGTQGVDNAAKFAAATSDVANLQVFLNLAASGYTPPASATSVTFSVDSVAVVPEPTSALLLGLTAPTLLALRRRRPTTPSVA